MIAKTFSATVLGIDAHMIEMEVDVSPSFKTTAKGEQYKKRFTPLLNS